MLPVPAAAGQALPSGLRLPGRPLRHQLGRQERRARLRRVLLGSLALHLVVLALFLLVPSPPPEVSQASPGIAMMFEAPAAGGQASPTPEANAGQGQLRPDAPPTQARATPEPAPRAQQTPPTPPSVPSEPSPMPLPPVPPASPPVPVPPPAPQTAPPGSSAPPPSQARGAPGCAAPGCAAPGCGAPGCDAPACNTPGCSATGGGATTPAHAACTGAGRRRGPGAAEYAPSAGSQPACRRGRPRRCTAAARPAATRAVTPGRRAPACAAGAAAACTAGPGRSAARPWAGRADAGSAAAGHAAAACAAAAAADAPACAAASCAQRHARAGLPAAAGLVIRGRGSPARDRPPRMGWTWPSRPPCAAAASPRSPCTRQGPAPPGRRRSTPGGSATATIRRRPPRRATAARCGCTCSWTRTGGWRACR